MKRIFLTALLLLILTGCSNKFINLTGESKNWTGKYSANIDGNDEDGSYEFHFKNGDGNTQFQLLEVIINDGSTTKSEENFKGATINITSNCKGCYVTKKDEKQKVTIIWDDKNEETFYLKDSKAE
ncbi:lipoprotein [Bacillus sp. V2I10]|uniref:lipoprotein n=1 Tax=Bacillus sp. V2I10 TaxID=3042276 RepID=UPI00277EE02E|nr:lipoprotein [Bacillus sp. V2I10]MDQ0859751.1 major membrane immunogen (membrane-anchored lipoprotein) [Bacillus sp. V2I10]